MNYKRAVYHFNRSDPQGLPAIVYTDVVLEDSDYYSGSTSLVTLETECEKWARQQCSPSPSIPYDNATSLQCCKNAGYPNWPPPYGSPRPGAQPPQWGDPGFAKDSNGNPCEPPPYEWPFPQPTGQGGGILQPSQTLPPPISGKPWCSQGDGVWPNGPISPIQKRYDDCIASGNPAFVCAEQAKNKWASDPDRQKAICCSNGITKYMLYVVACLQGRKGPGGTGKISDTSSSGGVPN